MKGGAAEFKDILSKNSTEFKIPVYQRNYDWRIEHCRRLYDDFVKIIREKKHSHFFGSIVSLYNANGESVSEYLIIDGQQRITTVSLLLLAMYNLMDKKIVTPVKPENDKLKDRILEDYLIDKYYPVKNHTKLRLGKSDMTAYTKLFGDVDDYIIDSNITENYMYFENRIQRQEITVDDLYTAICRLQIINIELENNDNPQLIFESLNSTGLDLSEGDKIRNYVLMGQPLNTQNAYYDNYWHQIEICTQYDVSSFVRDYLSVKLHSTPAQNKIYTTFHDYVESHNFETEPLLIDMLSYAKRYQVLLGGKKTSNADLNECIYRLNRLETTVTRPFFLEVLRLQDEGDLTIDQVSVIFQITESYLFRRSICDLPTNSLNKIFLTMHKDIERFDGTDGNYVEKYKYELLTRKDKSRFPDDEEFAKEFSEKQVYRLNNKNKIYILERINNFGTTESQDVYKECDDGKYSIEHIMPQDLTFDWQKALGEDCEQIHEEWQHRIANLTLTAYNPELSNKSFTEKKTMEHGFNDSGIRMNTYIAQKDKWALEELEERDAYLTDLAKTIWPEPKTDYRPAEKQLESYTLEDENELPGRHIVKFSFKDNNNEIPVKGWKDMYKRVIQMLYDEDESIITKLAVSSNEGLSIHFTTNPDEYKNYDEISKGIYVWTNNNTQNKLSVLNRLFVLYGESPLDLIFYLRDENDSDKEVPRASEEQHIKYWTMALPLIKEANDENGTFSKVHPTKGNGIEGSFGIGGFNIKCAINQDTARVEMYFGRTTEENKKTYDYLSAHKNEIENAPGVRLIWQRCDNKKASKIRYELHGMDIANEKEWQNIASFHAKWSKRFYDVLVPYIENAIQ